MSIQIKKLIAGEELLVTALFNQYRIFYNQPSDIQLAREFIRTRLHQNESVIFLAYHSQQGAFLPLGFTQLYPQYTSMGAKKNWILNDLFVQSANRKQGIGQELIQHAIQFAQANQSRLLQLETAVDNYAAQRLYEKLGFKQIPPSQEFLVYQLGLSATH